ncbi:MAG TPA: class I adenylate-forming enzyme family protein [Xanthobacteraceae bacterium]|nr:class I adenylate-forming enzyme family protein [Xanthobacteraceae bacterium]
MILGDAALTMTPPPGGQSRVTIDDIFRRMARRRPDALALADAPNRKIFTDGAARRLTYAEADRVITAIAARLRRMELPTDAIVGIQLPNIVENILTILGVMRAGMIAAPLPLLWRRADTIAALARIGAKALITSGHVGAFNHCQFAMRVAAEVFSIRYVCGFGADLLDGVVAFDDLFTAQKSDPLPPLERERQGHAASHVAAVTFDVGEGGVVPVARNHLELLAGGLGVLLESRLAQDATVLSTLAPSSFAGICLTLLPWLLRGGTLLLHHPFDPRLLASQWHAAERCGALILPGPIALRLAEAGLFTREGPAYVLGAWRSPDRLAASEAWHERDTNLVDVAIFGEAGLIAARRGGNGRPAPLPFGPIVAPRGSTGAVVVAELLQSRRGTLALRGPMVPHHTFPPGVERGSLPYFEIGPGGLIDTGYACRVDPGPMTVTVTGPPSAIVSVGGYRVPLHDLQDVVRRIDGRATLTALPDPLVGQRLIGNAEDRYTVQAALNAVGVNPLVVAAFVDRSDRGVAETVRSAARR